jgi:anti-sigma factor RsiW
MNADIHVLTGAYACDALDSGELGAFEEHLTECESCAQEVAELRATAAALALAEAVEPPQGLRERVMRQVMVTRQLPPIVSTPDPSADPATGQATDQTSPSGPAGARGHRARRRAGGGGPAATGTPGTNGTTGTTRPPSRRWTRSVAWISVTALLAGVVVLGGVVRHQQGEISALQGQTSAVTSLLAAPDARVTSGSLVLGGTATVISSSTDNGMIFSAIGLPPLPAGRAYQLWMIDAASVRPGPVLNPVDGKVPAVFAGGLDGAQSIAMTVEPSAGSTHPTTTPVLQLALST